MTDADTVKNDEKGWSYSQVTESAERQIASLAKTAAEHHDEARGIWCYQDWAYGVYIGWSNLTMGWQRDGDDERLKGLVEAVGK